MELRRDDLFIDPIDRPIIATADDAILAKQATVAAGYYEDPFLDIFSKDSIGITGGKKGLSSSKTTTTTTTTTSSFSANTHRQQQHHHHHQNIQRRSRHIQPIIKRGTHARVCCMDRAIRAFLSSISLINNKKQSNGSSSSSMQQQQQLVPQIVVLGAGKDTSYFRYRAGYITKQDQQQQEQQSTSQEVVHWYEVDHHSIIQQKMKTIEESAILSSSLEPTKYGYQYIDKSNNNNNDDPSSLSSSSSSRYNLIVHDLRTNPEELLLQKLQLNRNAPTLFLLECVLMYMPIDSCNELLTCIANYNNNNTNTNTNTIIVCYEPILGGECNNNNNNDPFGKMMEQNLCNANVVTNQSCLLQTRTLQQQLTKFVTIAGFHYSIGCDMWSAYETILNNKQRQRANQCEFLDEIEEWILIMKHYCFLVAYSSTNNNSDKSDSNDGEVLSLGAEFCRMGIDSPMGFINGKCMTLCKSPSS